MPHYHYLTIEQRERLDRQIRARIAELRADGAAPEQPAAELRELLAARERLHTPDYGVCADCGADIPYVRLEVTPTATRCSQCQSHPRRAQASDGSSAA